MGSICEAPQVQFSCGPLLISEYQYKTSTISILQGDLSEEDCDALVLSNTPTLSHDFPATRSLLNRAGPKPQAECVNLLTSLQKFQEGAAIYTTAGELEATFLIHAIVPQWQGEAQDKVFRECVRNCLKLAEKLRVSSISFSVLGTAKNCIPKETAAGLFFEELRQFIAESEDFAKKAEKTENCCSFRVISSENPTVRMLKNVADRTFFKEKLEFFAKKPQEVMRYKDVCLTTLEKNEKN